MLPSIHELDLKPSCTDLPNHDRQVVDIHPSTASTLPMRLPILALPPPAQMMPTIWDPTLRAWLPAGDHALHGSRPWAPAGASMPSPPATRRSSTSSNSTTLPTPTSSIASPIIWAGQIDSPQQHEPDPTNHPTKHVVGKECRSQRTSSHLHRTKSNGVAKPRDRRTKPTTSKAKKYTKSMEEQKRRRNESDLQRRMQDFLILRGHEFTEPLSKQNVKVSGLKYNKLEIMEEFLHEMEEMEDPYAALVRHIARWRKLKVQIPRAEELVTLVKAMPELSDKCGRDMDVARLLVGEMQRLLPSRHLNLVGVDVTVPEKELKEQLRRLGPPELQQRLTDLAEVLKGEWERWRAGKKRLASRILALKRKIVMIESGGPESAYSPSVSRSFRSNKRFPKIFSLDDLKRFTTEWNQDDSGFIKSRL